MMHSSLFLLSTLTTATTAQIVKGFNYGSIGQTTSTYITLFNNAKGLRGASGFDSARLFTMIQDGTVDSPTEAIPAAIDTNTTLLLGLWASAGDTALENELAALKSAISQYGPLLKAATIGVSVGSEDLYRITPTGITNNAGLGVGPDVLVKYIGQVRSLVAGTALADVPIGHVDTWTGWVNGSNLAVIEASDFLGMDAYPYYQYQQENDISNAATIFNDAYEATQSVAKGKPVWITETGWPTTGPTYGDAVANVQNAEKYWKEVGCKLFGTTNIWWFDLQGSEFSVDASGDQEKPSYDLSCSQSADPSLLSIKKPSSTATPTSYTSAMSTASIQDPSWTATTKITSADFSAISSVPCGTCTDFVGIGSTTTLVTTYTTTYCPSSTRTFRYGNGDTSTSVVPYATYTTVITTSAAQYPSTTLKSSVTPIQPPSAVTNLPSTSILPVANCGTTLAPNFEFPHLIVHLNKSQPNAQPGPSYYGWVYPDTSSGFNFDIPLSAANMTCSLVFLLPRLQDLKTSTFAFEGSGGLIITKLNAPIVDGSTFAAVAAAGETSYGVVDNIQPGNGYVIKSVSCREYAGHRVAFKVSTDDSTELNWFEDCNPPALGLFMNIC